MTTMQREGSWLRYPEVLEGVDMLLGPSDPPLGGGIPDWLVRLEGDHEGQPVDLTCMVHTHAPANVLGWVSDAIRGREYGAAELASWIIERQLDQGKSLYEG